MNVTDLLKSPPASLPRMKGKDSPPVAFAQVLDSLFENYLAAVSCLDEKRDAMTKHVKGQLPLIKLQCKMILDTITLIYDGKHLSALNCFDRLASDASTYLRPTNLTYDTGILDEIPYLDNLYRVRADPKDGAYFTRKDLFHIPYENRSMVRRQRYSLPGLPCLYLGNTVLGCWEELGRPSFTDMYVCRLSVTDPNSLRILDFGYRPECVAWWMENKPKMFGDEGAYYDLASRVAIMWPLLAACSIQRQNREHPFIEEYIIPQLVLHWLVEHDSYDGLRYFSVNTNRNYNWPLYTWNYVFPSRIRANNGHCKTLMSMFSNVGAFFFPSRTIYGGFIIAAPVLP